MPRGAKGSGKAAKKATISKKNKADSTPAKKQRKAYPSAEERVALAKKLIQSLKRINASREALIEKTEATLNARKSALVNSKSALEKALAKKERLVNVKDKTKKVTKPSSNKENPKPKMTPEELKAFRVELMAKARAAKKAKRGEVVPSEPIMI